MNYEYEDVHAIREEVPIVRAVSAEMDRDFGFKVGTRVVSIGVRGVELPYGQMRNLAIEDGRYFNESDFIDHRRVVIMGYDANKKVFQGAPSIGQNVTVGGLTFEVIGVLRNKIQDSMYNGPDNQNAFIPFDVFRDLKDIRIPDNIIFQPAAAELNTKALAAVREVLARRHHFDPKDEKAAVAWDTIENRQMINAFSLGLASRTGIDRRGNTLCGRRGSDEHHAGLGHRTYARDRPPQSFRCAAPSCADPVPAGSLGADLYWRAHRDGCSSLSDLGDSAHAPVQQPLQDHQSRRRHFSSCLSGGDACFLHHPLHGRHGFRFLSRAKSLPHGPGGSSSLRITYGTVGRITSVP